MLAVRVFDALQTRIRRVCFVVEQISAEISTPFHITFFFCSSLYSGKVNDPFRRMEYEIRDSCPDE